MTVLQRLRAGPLCGVFPRRLEARLSAGRVVLMATWRGDRATALAFAAQVAAHPSPLTVSLLHAEYVFDADGPRRLVESHMDFQQPLRDLLEEQAQRQQRRDASARRRVQWRAPQASPSPRSSTLPRSLSA